MTAERRQGLLYLLVGAGNTAFGLATFAALQVTVGDVIGYLAELVIAWVIDVLECSSPTA